MWRLPLLRPIMAAVWIPFRHMTSKTSLHTLLGDADLEDEEQLARLLVQDVSVLPTSPRRNPMSDAVCSALPESAPARVDVGMEMPVGNESTLAGAIFEVEHPDLQCSGLPITSTRRANSHLAKYSHVRRAVHTKQVTGDATPMKEMTLEWMCCGCRTYNFVGRRSCRCCKRSELESCKHSTAPARHLPLFPGTWACHLCGHSNTPCPTDAASRDKFSCENCGKPFPGIREWYCPSCCHINSRGSTQCATCYAERPSRWSCSVCGHHKNSVFFTECRSCHSPRRKLVSDSTTLCPGCRQRNDVQWEMCFMCMAPLRMMDSVRRLRQSGEKAARKAGNEVVTHSVGEKDEGSQSSDQPNAGVATIDVIAEVTRKQMDVTIEDTVGGPHEAEEAERRQREQEQNQPTSGDGSVTSNSAIEVTSRAVSLKPRAAERSAWWCAECNVLQRRNVGFCDVCLKPKAIVDTKGAIKSLAADMSATGVGDEATCSTGDGTVPQNGNQGGSIQVSVCGKEHCNSRCHETPKTPTPSALPSVVVDASSLGKWRCPYCRNLVDVMVTSCCSVARETPFGYWRCTTCCSTNRDERARCLGCGSPPQAVKPWRCYLCRRQNDADVFQCDYCGSAHPRHWLCARCGTKCQNSVGGRCPSCDTPKKKLEVVVCPHCSAPNNFLRKSCFRCRVRLSSDAWSCEKCGHNQNDKNSRRCRGCGEPRQFNMEEIIWVCDVCNTAVASGGALKERKQCPRCNADRTDRSLEIPSRWQCRSCGVANSYSVPTCLDCGARRILTNMRTHTSCPACFRLTLLDVKEQCSHCGTDMSGVISDVGSFVSSAGLASAVSRSVDPFLSVDGGQEYGCVLPPTTNFGPENVSSGPEALLGPGANTPEDITVADTHVPSLCEDTPLTVDVGAGLHAVEVFDFPQGEGELGHLMQFNDEGSQVMGSASECEVLDGNDEDEGNACDMRLEELGGTVCSTYDDWCGSIPSWICSNCESRNLDEADVCVECAIVRCSE